MSASEHPVTRRARMAVSKVNSIAYTLHCVEAELDKAKFAMRDAFLEMERANLPAEPWENHHRVNLDMPRR